MEIKDWLIKTLQEADNAKARSMQKEIGASQIGDCRAKTWLQMKGVEGTNPTLKLPAIMGTAIHKIIEEAIERIDPFAEKYELEQEVIYGDVKGHVDLYIPESKHIVDWKSTKKKNKDYFPSLQQRWQVQLYAYAMNGLGKPVETVTLFSLARDGDERHILVHSEPYDQAVAQDALNWYEDLKSRETQPAGERDPFSFCKYYCEFYGKHCSGKDKAVADGELIDDLNAAKAAIRYLEINSLIKTLEDEKEAVKTELEGVSGVLPNGVSIKWSEVAGRQSIDEAEITKALGFVPKKQGEPSLRLADRK